MNHRGRERRGRPAPAPVSLRTARAFAEVIADPGDPSSRTLRLDGREAGQVDLRDPRALAFAYMRRIADLLDAFRPAGAGVDVLHVGGGACALPRYVEATRPRSRQLVFEIDPGVVALAREHFGLRASPRLRVKVGDAADLIAAREDRSFDLVIGDAFDGPHVPARLSDAAFVGEVRRVLRPSGVYGLNVIDVPPLDEAREHAALVKAAFAHVVWVAPPGVLRARAPGNVVLLASAVALPVVALQRAAAAAVPR
ncbi:MAG TPA: fused MFS/spermidine synthase, partial [Solirubrobacter sp.]